MFARVAWLCVALTGALLVACSEDPELQRRGGSELPEPTPDPDLGQGGSAVGGAGPGEAVTFCDALAIVRTSCQRCHSNPPENGAPVPFVTYDDFQAIYFEPKKWWERAREMVEIDYMPYLELNGPPTNLMPPVQPLTPAEKATLLAWFEQGALPEGGTDCP